MRTQCAKGLWSTLACAQPCMGQRQLTSAQWPFAHWESPSAQRPSGLMLAVLWLTAARWPLLRGRGQPRGFCWVLTASPSCSRNVSCDSFQMCIGTCVVPHLVLVYLSESHGESQSPVCLIHFTICFNEIYFHFCTPALYICVQLATSHLYGETGRHSQTSIKQIGRFLGSHLIRNISSKVFFVHHIQQRYLFIHASIYFKALVIKNYPFDSGLPALIFQFINSRFSHPPLSV